MQVIRKAIMVLLSVMLWAIILLMALFTFTTLATRDEQSVGRLAGFTPLTVKSDSMAPTFREGDLIVIRECSPASLQVGDIITFHTIINNEYALNTHRIAEIKEVGEARCYVTKGDNNAIEDTHMISDGDIVGRYVGKVPVLGKVLAFLSGKVGFLVVIVLPMLLFFIYQVYHLVMVSIDLKKAIAVEGAQNLAQQNANAKLAEAEAMKQAAKDARVAAQQARHAKMLAERSK